MHNGFPIVKPRVRSQSDPLWSVMVPTYNPGIYLEKTLMSVLEQDDGATTMQIAIVDDNSSDNTPIDLLKKLGLDDRVEYYRHRTTLGLAGNWNSCIDLARGEFVHILHQDDFIHPGFYRELRKGFFQEQYVGAAFCRCQVLEEASQRLVERELLQSNPGVLQDWLEIIATKNRILTPSIVVRRKVYELLGGYYTDLYFALDWEMWVRIANSYHVWYEPKTLATYRTHDESETANLSKSIKTIPDIRHSFSVRSSYLPQDINIRTERIARHNYAKFAFRHASNLFDKHEWRTGIKLIAEGLKCSQELGTIRELFKMLGIFVAKRVEGHSKRLFKSFRTF